MFNWTKYRVYSWLLTKAEKYLIRVCIKEWKEGNDFSEWHGIEDEEYFDEGFKAGWIASQVVTNGVITLDSIKFLVKQEEAELSTDRQGKDE